MGYDLRVMVGGFYEIFLKVLFIVFGLIESIVLEIRVGFWLFILGFLLVIGVFLVYEGILVVNGFGVLGLMLGFYFGLEFVKLVFEMEMEIDFSDYDVRGVIEF